MEKPKLDPIAIDLLATIAKHAPDLPEAREAFNTFCDIYREHILDICLDYCEKLKAHRYEVEAEELCHDILLKIALIAGQFNHEKGNLLSWLRRIIWNEILTRFRKQKKLPKFVSLEAVIGVSENEYEQKGIFLDQNLKKKTKQLKSALASMPASQKDILLMTMKYAPYDLPDEETNRIVREYSIGRSSIKTYRMRAKATLEKVFGKSINWECFKALVEIDQSWYE